jgi:hypothetical protein
VPNTTESSPVMPVIKEIKSIVLLFIIHCSFFSAFAFAFLLLLLFFKNRGETTSQHLRRSKNN